MSETPPGPPYKSQVASVGGISEPTPDVPICAVFLVFYIVSAASHMTIFQLNNRQKHKFIPSVLLFGFSVARILTLSLRIGAAYHPDNVSLSIATMIFLNAGILIVYIINILFATRILRARQPQVGWHPALRIFFKIVYALIGLGLVLVIVFVNISFYTLDTSLRLTARDIQLAAMTYFLLVTFLPLVLLAISSALPKSPKAETFGSGRMEMKSLIVTISSLLCVLGAGFKAGANWAPARPIDSPAWYQSRACFYIFYFVLEILILYMFLFTRIDKRFHVSNGSSKRNTFVPPTGEDLEAQEQTRRETQQKQNLSSGRPSADTTEKEKPEV